MTDNHLLAGHGGASFCTASGQADQACRENITGSFYRNYPPMSRDFPNISAWKSKIVSVQCYFRPRFDQMLQA
jgi:hypothetical protein